MVRSELLLWCMFGQDTNELGELQSNESGLPAQHHWLSVNQITRPLILVREKQDHLERKDNLSLESQRDRNRKGTVWFRNVSALCSLGIVSLAKVRVSKRKWRICISKLTILWVPKEGKVIGEGEQEEGEEWEQRERGLRGDLTKCSQLLFGWKFSGWEN